MYISWNTGVRQSKMSVQGEVCKCRNQMFCNLRDYTQCENKRFLMQLKDIYYEAIVLYLSFSLQWWWFLANPRTLRRTEDERSLRFPQFSTENNHALLLNTRFNTRWTFPSSVQTFRAWCSRERERGLVPSGNRGHWRFRKGNYDRPTNTGNTVNLVLLG